MKRLTPASLARIFGAVAFAFVLGTMLQFARAWTEPTVAPPNVNVGAPITTGSQAQTKTGTISINRWDSQYLAGYGTQANKRSIGGAYGWDREKLYINGFGDWANGVSIGGNIYGSGSANFHDVYIRSIGKWASNLSSGPSHSYQLKTCIDNWGSGFGLGPGGTCCPSGTTSVGCSTIEYNVNYKDEDYNLCLCEY